MDSPRGSDTHYEPVSAAVSALILRLLDGWTPKPPPLGNITRLEWGGTDVTASAASIRINEDVLEVDWQDDSEVPLVFRHDEYEPFRNQPFEGNLDSGWRFSAESGTFGDAWILEGRYWLAEALGQPAVLWIAKLDGVATRGDLEDPSNLRALRIRDGTAHVTWGHRLQGAYTYYLIPRTEAERAKSWFLIIDTGGDEVPSRRPVFQDLLALQFVLGRGMFFDLIYGVDLGLDIVGLVGGRHGRDHGRRPRTAPAVPLVHTREHWPGQFFEAISSKYRERPELRIYIALTFYLDSLTSMHVEGRYLALHVALEAFAYWFLEQEAAAEKRLVDKTKWKTWLVENKPALIALATEGMGEVLFSKITSVPARRASSRVVEEAFRRTGIEILPVMADELEEGRGRIVHTAAMFPETQEQLDAYLKPIRLVRTMLVALVSRVVGYGGAIVGWERPGQTADAGWWPVDPACREHALRRYDVQIEKDSAATNSPEGVS